MNIGTVWWGLSHVLVVGAATRGQHKSNIFLILHHPLLPSFPLNVSVIKDRAWCVRNVRLCASRPHWPVWCHQSVRDSKGWKDNSSCHWSLEHSHGVLFCWGCCRGGCQACWQGMKNLCHRSWWLGESDSSDRCVCVCVHKNTAGFLSKTIYDLKRLKKIYKHACLCVYIYPMFMSLGSLNWCFPWA